MPVLSDTAAVGGSGSSLEAHLARMVFRVRVRVRPFSHSREVRFWTRPGGCFNVACSIAGDR